MTEPSIAPHDNSCACENLLDKKIRYQVSAAREACGGEISEDSTGNKYCVLHYPDKSKNKEDFLRILKEKLAQNDFNFTGVYFPDEIHFSNFRAKGAVSFLFPENAIFTGATINDVGFEYVIFKKSAIFNYVNFNEDARFLGAIFEKDAMFIAAKFNQDADFRNTQFGTASFISALFQGSAHFESERRGSQNDCIAIFKGEADFSNADFTSLVNFEDRTFAGLTKFDSAQFKNTVRFKATHNQLFHNSTSLDFNKAQFEKPERLSFHSVSLRPHWFINTDPRKFEFVEVDWSKFTFEQEREASKSDRLLSTAYRQLAMNADENNRYIEATKFRYNSMDLRRLEKSNGYAFWTLDFWYWALSGYGERVGRATVALLLILFLSCVPYWLTGFASSKDTTQNKIGAPIQMMLAPEHNKAKQFLATLVYSLETASLQKPEPRPVTTMARLFVGLETILAPLQAALLALAIRRKYMR